MARSVLSSIDQLTDMITREESHLRNVQSEVQSIRQELLSMQPFLKEGYGGVDVEKVAIQQQSLQDIIYDAEAAIVNYVVGTAREGKKKPLLKRRTCWKDFRVHENFCKEIKRILGLIKDLKQEPSSHYSGGESFNLADLIRHSVEAEEVLRTVVGLRQGDMKSLKAELFSEEDHSVISLVGIQGIGKTTLAWEIYKSPSVESHFLNKAWVCVSAMDGHLTDILDDIKKQFFTSWKDDRYLIVIDDVRDPQLWRELKDKIPKGGPGSRIILTTRDLEVASSTDCSHRLKVLSKEESWELLKRKVFIAPWQLSNASGKHSRDTRESPNHSLPLELYALGKELVGKCGGIPYLIVELANLLSTVYADPEEWSCVLHGTETHLSPDQHPWFNLSSSVDDILPLHVKQVLNIFPTPTQIPLRRFIRSMGEELLWQQSNSGNCDDEEEAAATRLLQDLQDLDLIQPVEVSSIGITKTYQILPDHPLVQILKAGSAGGSSDCKVWIHRLAYDCNTQDSHSAKLEPYGSLCSFWCFNYTAGYKPGQEVGSFLKRCINNNYLWFLRVLDLEGLYKPNLPDAIGELINLQYLGLRWTFLDKLPSSVQNLQKLQTLDTKHTDIGVYPTIQNMQRLQHLYLNERHPSKLVTQLSSLRNLQTLSGVIVDDLNHLKDGLEKLTNLRKLRLTCRLYPQQRESIAKWIGELENLQTLKLTFKDQMQQRSEQVRAEQATTLSLSSLNLRRKQLSRMYLQGQLENLDHYDYHNFGSKLTALTLSLTKLESDPMPILGKLPELKLLRLFSKSFNGNTMSCSSESFKQLQVLKIWKLEGLKQWTVEDGAMPKLEELEIRSCKNLEMLPDHLPKALPELKFTAMPKEFTSNVMGKDCEKVAHVSSVLIEYWSDSINSAMLYTGRTSIFKGRLGKLFDLNGFAGNLNELTLFGTKLEEDPMPVLGNLPELMRLSLAFKSFMGKLMVCKGRGFQKLKQLAIWELENLEELTVENEAMPAIEELEIRSCENLKVLPQGLGNLKNLKLAKMPKKFTEKYKTVYKRVVIED